MPSTKSRGTRRGAGRRLAPTERLRVASPDIMFLSFSFSLDSMRAPSPVAPGGIALRLVFLLALGILIPGLLAAPGDVGAQTVDSPYRFIDTRQEVEAFLGQLRPSRGDLGFGPGTGPVLGARYGLHLGGPFSLEGVLSASPTTRDVIDPTAAGDRVIGEADVLLAALEARIKFSLTGHRTWYGLSPHLLVGGGGMVDLAPDQEADLALPLDQRFTFDTSFLGSFGGGVRWLPGDRFGLRTDLLLSFWKINTPPGFSFFEEEIGPIEESQWVQAPTITFGASIRF